MKISFAPCALALLVLGLVPQIAFSNPVITWSDPVAIKSASQIDGNGKLVHAGYWGSDPIAMSVHGERIVFAPRKLGDPGSTDGSAGATGNGLATGSFTANSGDPQLDLVLNSFAYDGANPRTITLEGLNAGNTYEVQLFALDDRTDSAEGDRPLRYGDHSDFSGSNSKVFLEKDNVFVIGRFKADSSKISIYEEISQNGNFNAYVLRDVTSK